ncbi:MAG: PAS domain S-box protein [Pseudohongiellaceae bacterium]
MKQFEKHAHKLSPESFLEAITHFSPSFVSVLDTQGVIQFVNRTTEGLTNEKVLGQSIFEYLGNETEAAKLKACFESVIKAKNPQRVEINVSRPNGVFVLWETRVSPIIEADKVTGLVLFTNDITQQRAIEIEQQAVFDLSEEFWCILKFDGYLDRVNPAFTSKLGYSEEELLSTPFINYIHPDDKERTIEAFRAASGSGGQPTSIENRYLAKDGSAISIRWDGTLDLNAQRFIAVGKDVTENRSLEQQLGQAQKIDAIGHLAGGVAHDFNNLLMAITANSELGMMSQNIDEIKRRLSDIDSAALKAAELTHKLLTFSREQPAQKEPLEFNDLIQNFMNLLERVIPENIELIFNPDPTITQILGDPVQLEQVIMNLCVNARDSIVGSGKIEITTEQRISTESPQKTNQICLRVTDSGTGIPNNLINKIFNPFFTTKQEGKGTGLGLSTAYGIVKNHKGLISVEHTGIGGTTMLVTLPAQEFETTEKQESQQPTAIGGSETILLAEDEELVASAATRTLKKAGYKVVLATNGEEALKICCDREDIDIAFIDVVMPKIDGPEVAAAMKLSRPDLPIIFASGYSPESHRELINQYRLIGKPYRSSELLSSIREVLDNN